MRTVDYSFLKKEIPGNIVGTVGIIADLNARNQIRKLQYEKAFDELRKKAIIESVKGSNEIEGIVTTEERIRDLVAGAAPVTHDEKEISGYKDVLNLIHTEHENLDVSRDVILMFHRMMEEAVNPAEAGNFKSRDNLIMEYLSDGSRRVRFTPVKAGETEKAMEQLLLAYYDARQDMEIPVLFLIPCFIVDFLCIHPFLDGNGRVSRLLTVLMLYIAGYDIGKYISVENQINRYKESYYAALEQSSAGWHENKNDYSTFIINFLQILYRCFRDLDESFMDISLKKAKKSERVEAVLMGAIAPVSKADIHEKLPDVSVKTIELVLSKMLKDEKIEKIGTYRDARYMKRR